MKIITKFFNWIWGEEKEPTFIETHHKRLMASLPTATLAECSKAIDLTAEMTKAMKTYGDGRRIREIQEAISKRHAMIQIELDKGNPNV